MTSHVDNRQLVLLRIDRATGQVHWTERLRGEYRASPVIANGRIFIRGHDALYCIEG